MKISKQFALASCFFFGGQDDSYTRTITRRCHRRSQLLFDAAFLPLLKKETATESQQFIERFGRYYLIIAILGVLAAIFNRPLLSIGFIFFVLLLSTLFSLTFAKKMS